MEQDRPKPFVPRTKFPEELIHRSLSSVVNDTKSRTSINGSSWKAVDVVGLFNELKDSIGQSSDSGSSFPGQKAKGTRKNGEFLPNDIPFSNFQRYINVYKNWKQLRNVGNASTEDKPTRRARDEIPAIFFSTSFALHQRSTFSSVMTNHSVGSPILHHEIGNYLDLIEVRLVDEVSRRSDSVFQALTNMKDLHLNTSETFQAARNLRHALAIADHFYVRDASRVVQLVFRRKHCLLLVEKMELIKTMTQTLPTIEQMLVDGDISEALSLLYSVQKVLRTQLAGFHCMKSTSRRLAILRIKIYRRIVSSFIHYTTYSFEPNEPIVDLNQRESKVISSKEMMKNKPRYPSLHRELSTHQQRVVKEFVYEILGGSKGRDGLHEIASSTSTTTPDVESNEPVIRGKDAESGVGEETFFKAMLQYRTHSLAVVQQLVVTIVTGKNSHIPTEEEFERILMDLDITELLPRLSTLYSNLINMLRHVGLVHDSLLKELWKLLPNPSHLNVPKPLEKDFSESITKSAKSNIESVTNFNKESAGIPPQNSLDVAIEMELSEFASEGDKETHVDVKKFLKDRSSILEVGQVEKQSVTRGNFIVESQLPSHVLLREKAIKESLNIMQAISVHVETVISRVLKFRLKKHSKLSQDQFNRFMTLNETFISFLESTTDSHSYVLRPTLLLQTRDYLETFHSQKIATMRNILDNESWRPVAIAEEFKKIIRVLMVPSFPLENPDDSSIEGSSRRRYSPHRVKLTKTASEEISSSNKSSELESSNRNKDISSKSNLEAYLVSKASASTIEIKSQRYYLVNSTLMFTKLLHDYLLFLRDVPLVGIDIVSRIVELFQLFNSRTYTLILRQGALNSGHMEKGINVKHLAVANQALLLINEAIQPIKIRLQNMLVKIQREKNEVNYQGTTGSQSDGNSSRTYNTICDSKSQTNSENRGDGAIQAILNDLDRVEANYREHQHEIMLKFITIMQSRAKSGMTGFPEEVSTTGSASKCLEGLLKKTKLLQKAVSLYLTEEQLQLVFRQIYISYSSVIRDSLKSMTSASDNTKNRLKAEMGQFIRHLRGLLDVGDLSYLEELLCTIDEIPQLQ